MINKVEICGVNTSKLPVLSNEEKQELLIKTGDGALQILKVQPSGKKTLSVQEFLRGYDIQPGDLLQ